MCSDIISLSLCLVKCHGFAYLTPLSHHPPKVESFGDCGFPVCLAASSRCLRHSRTSAAGLNGQFQPWLAYACAYSVVSDSVTQWTVCSLPASVHGVFQARVLEWVAISSSTISSKPRDRTQVSCVGRWILYHWCHLGSLVLGLC